MGSRLPDSKEFADAIVALTPSHRVDSALDISGTLDNDNADAVEACSQQRLADYGRDPSVMVPWEEFLARVCPRR